MAIRVLRSSSAELGVGSGLSTVFQFALSSFTDFCQHKDLDFAVEDFKFVLSGDGNEKNEDLGDGGSLSMAVSLTSETSC